MDATLSKTDNAMMAQTFDGGLTITASHIRLGEQTWMVGQVKRISIQPEGTFSTFFWCALVAVLALFFAFQWLAWWPLLITAVAGFAAWGAWEAMKTGVLTVSMDGVLDTILLTSKNKEDLERARSMIERATAEHTPA